MRIFLTGASSGIGAALARHYAAAGVTLGLAARHQRRLSDLVAELPGVHATYSLDVVDAPALHAAATDFIAVWLSGYRDCQCGYFWWDGWDCC